MSPSPADPTRASPRVRRRGPRCLLLKQLGPVAVLRCVPAFLGLVGGCQTSSNAGPSQPVESVPVRVSAVAQEDVPVEISAIGWGEASATVTMRPQIEGQIAKVHFEQGQEVKAGDLLFTIDPRPFAAAVRLAEANLERDAAAARDAESELRRVADLYSKRVAAERERDHAQAGADSARAQVTADRAAVDLARLRLEYCEIHAPFTSRTGARLVDLGKSVKANETDLVVLNQVRPLYVAFSVAEKHLAEIRERMRSTALEVQARLPGDDAAAELGELTFVDNQVDATAGMIRLKGTFPNTDGRMWPGQFVNVSLVVSRHRGALLVPTQAVQSGQHGPFVFVIKADRSVELRPVETIGVWKSHTIVRGRLSPGEQVVTDGQLRLAPGMKVELKSGESASQGTPS